MEKILNLFVIIVEVLCLKNFIGIFKKRTKNQYVNTISEILLIFFIYALDYFFQNIVIVKMMLVATLILIFICLSYNVKIVHAMFMSVTFLCLLTFLDVVVWFLLKNLFEKNVNIAELDAVSVYYVTLLTRIVAVALIMYAKRKVSDVETKYLMDGKQLLKYMYFPFMTVIIIVGVLVYCDQSMLHNNIVIIMVSLLVIMNFIIFSIIESVVRYEKQLSENRIFERDMKSKYEYYQYVCENYENQRQEIHEFRNQMECILDMMHNEEYNKTEKFVRNITADLNDKTDCIDTKNAIINAVLNQKYRVALKRNILMVFDLQPLSEIYLKDTDIVSILSNLIDNAIENCDKCKNKKTINIMLKIDNADNFIISVKNTIPSKYKFDKNNIVSSKKDKMKHGYGIKNIIKIVEKNHGHYDFECNENEFWFSVIIPQK